MRLSGVTNEVYWSLMGLTSYLQLVIQLVTLTSALVYLSLRKGAKVQPRSIPPQQSNIDFKYFYGSFFLIALIRKFHRHFL